MQHVQSQHSNISLVFMSSLANQASMTAGEALVPGSLDPLTDQAPETHHNRDQPWPLGHLSKSPFRFRLLCSYETRPLSPRKASSTVVGSCQDKTPFACFADPTAIRGPPETTRGARRLAESQWGRGVEQLENAFRSGGNPIGGSHL